MVDILFLEEIAIALLLIATLVGILARRSRMPYTVGLVIMGVALSILFRKYEFSVSPQLILGIFIPPLIFEAAFHLPFEDLRRNLAPILTLAVPGVLVTTLLAGGIVHQGAGLPLAYAIVFGSIVAATDPVAVIALLRTLHVPRRLQVLLESESLLNDGTAIVVYNLAVASALSGTIQPGEALLDFIRVSGFGIVIGLALGWLASVAIARINDHLIETSITFVLAFGAYLVAESFHVSGVLAVVAAGLVNGNIGPRGMSATTRIVVFNFWEFMSFLANSFVFLLIGLAVDIPLLVENWQAILWGIFAGLLARLLVIYGFFPRSPTLPTSWKHILYWGGLRGAVSLALVLGLPPGLSPLTGKLQAMVFGLVIFTLLVQGTTMSALIKRLGLGLSRPVREEYDLRRARAMTVKAAYQQMKKVHAEGMISNRVWMLMSESLEAYLKGLADSMHAHLEQHPDMEAEELDAAWREFLRHQRVVLSGLHTDFTISDEAYDELSSQIDQLLGESKISWASVRDLNDSLWQIIPDSEKVDNQTDFEDNSV